MGTYRMHRPGFDRRAACRGQFTVPVESNDSVDIEGGCVAGEKLYRSTVVIWSDFDPKTVEIDRLAREAMNGDSICSAHIVAEVPVTDDLVPEEVLSFFNLL